MTGSTWTANSAEETESLGRALAGLLRPGDVLLLRGELGAGKTVLARGIARGLGVRDAVTSPTFTLVNCYQEKHPFHHFDLYRLDGEEAFYSAGLEEYLGGATIAGEAIAVVEWPERCEGAMPARHLEICLTYGEEENQRLISLMSRGGFREVCL